MTKYTDDECRAEYCIEVQIIHKIETDVYLIDVDKPSVTNEYVNNGCHMLPQSSGSVSVLYMLIRD